MPFADTIRAIHATPQAGVFWITGGGSLLLSSLMTEPGASGTVLEATIPYSNKALAEGLGYSPTSSASALVARQMAVTAYHRAQTLMTNSVEAPFGLGICCALATTRARAGSDRAFIAIHAQHESRLLTIRFPRDSETTPSAAGHERRQRQENDLLAMAIDLLCQHLDIAPPHLELRSDCQVEAQRAPSKTSWQSVMGPTTAASEPGLAAPVLFPGAFNPVHSGHLQMKTIAEQLLNLPLHFELSVHNVDKAGLDYFDLAERVPALSQHGNVILTNAPTFLEKAALFPDATFVVGIDTLIRIEQPDYYGSASLRDEAIAQLLSRRPNFLVFGRLHEGKYRNLADITISADLRARCTMVDEALFRADISSTELRAKREQIEPSK